MIGFLRTPSARARAAAVLMSVALVGAGVAALTESTAAAQTAGAESSASGDGSGAREFISAMADQVIAVLGDKGISSADRLARIEKIAHERFDFPTISRLVLARNWSKLSPAQQADFTRQFEKHLSITYGRNFDQYSGQAVKVLGDRKEPRGDWTVQTAIENKGEGEDFLVDYRLRKISGQWRVIDVVVERVSLVANFRSQFQDLIQNRGVDKTLALLREKNASGETILPPKEQQERKAG